MSCLFIDCSNYGVLDSEITIDMKAVEQSPSTKYCKSQQRKDH